MSPQIICLKGRTNFRESAEFGPPRLFAFELRRWGDAARPSAGISLAARGTRAAAGDAGDWIPQRGHYPTLTRTAFAFRRGLKDALVAAQDRNDLLSSTEASNISELIR